MARQTIGIVGAGQLALMMFEASLRLDLEIRVLASSEDDTALRVVPRTRVGDPRDRSALHSFASEVDVVTFDHELIDIAAVADLVEAGHLVRPGRRALEVAVDKGLQHATFRELRIPQPPTCLIDGVEALREVVGNLGPPVVIKHVRGGYDGRGVHIVTDLEQLEAHIGSGVIDGSAVLAQPRIELDAEVAIQVVRSANGEIVTYPVVRTVQEDGICRMVQMPADIPDELALAASEMAVQLADHLEVVGVLAVEYFVSNGQLLINEIAARPHNSGHLTIESCVTSQFENHLRAVAGLPLGSTTAVVGAAAMVNIIGSEEPPSGGVPCLPIDAAVHLYGKAHRPGRKLGHVTAVGESLDEVTQRARRAARVLEHGGPHT